MGVTESILGARPNSWNAKLRTLSLSYGHENPGNSLGRATWYFIHKISVLIYNDRNTIDVYIALYMFHITSVNYSSNSLFCIGVINRKGLQIICFKIFKCHEIHSVTHTR